MPRAPLVVLAALLLTPGLPAQDAAKRIADLTVAYAGQEGHARTREWTAFLAGRVRSVRTLPLLSLSAETVKDVDVVIVDAPSPYKPGGIKLTKGSKLSARYGKPTVLLGAAGGSTLSKLRIKLDWL